MRINKIKSQFNEKRIRLHTRIPLPSPLVLYVEPSGYCNFHCKFCPHGLGATFKEALMTFEMFQKVITDASAFHKTIPLLRICGNGEPLINQKIFEMVRLAKEKHIFQKIELITNGVLLNDHLIHHLPHYLSRIIISVEGLNSQEYKRISGINLKYNQFIQKIAQLYKNRNACKIHIKINNAAIHSQHDQQQFYSLFNPISDELYIENLIPLWPQYHTKFSSHHHRFKKRILHHAVCVQIFKSLQVQANGDVIPCCVDWNRTNLLGNISQTSLFDIWNGTALKLLQVKHLLGRKHLLQTCKQCTMNDYSDTDSIDAHTHTCLNRILK